jgi:hypothetical protein
MGDVTTAFVKQFGSNIMMLSQQKGSKLRNSVMLKPGIVGEEAYIDQLGKTSAVKRTTRHMDTPIIDPDHLRRKIFLFDWISNTLLDKEDEIKMLIDPQSSYAQNAVWALGLASAWTGKEGTTEVTFPAGNIVAAGGTGLTVAKLIAIKEILDLNEVDEDEERFIAVTAHQITDLLGTTEVTSADYNVIKALVKGEINTFMGFEFKRVSAKMVAHVVSTDVRSCVAWAKNGLGLGVAEDIKTRISERADKNYATQVFASLGIGATRVDEDRVVQIECDESPA